MTQLYARVFVKILQSSLADDWHVRHVFEDFLKLTSESGVVDVTRQAFCRVTNTPRDIFDRAIEVLESPDPQSRDGAHEGRRLLRMDGHRDWGWVIVNWEKYDSIRSRHDQREVERLKKRELRQSKATLPPAPPTQPRQDSDSDSDSESPGLVPDMSRTSPGQCSDDERELPLPIPQPLPLEAPKDSARCPHTTAPVKTRHIERAAASRRILEKLNSASGRSFEPVPANLTLIEARLADCKDDEDGVSAMIVRQCLLWAGTDMAQYLRPATLFNRTKFRQYYDDRNQPVAAGPGNRPAGGQSRSHRNEYIGDEESRASWAQQAAARIDETVEGFAPGVG